MSKRREAEADRADAEMLREISQDPGVERKRLERAGKGLQMLTELIERRRLSGFEVCKALLLKSGTRVGAGGDTVSRLVMYGGGCA